MPAWFAGNMRGCARWKKLSTTRAAGRSTCLTLCGRSTRKSLPFRTFTRLPRNFKRCIPTTGTCRDKIRQQLQVLRDLGFVEFLGRRALPQLVGAVREPLWKHYETSRWLQHPYHPTVFCRYMWTLDFMLGARTAPTKGTMPYDPEIHHRRSIRLRGYDYSQPGGYFVTI